jgi:DNA repair protein RadA/Sms
MARSSTVFACTACGHESPKWHGRCPGCGEWNTMAEEKRAPAASGGSSSTRSRRALKPVPLGQVEAPRVERLKTGIGEFDRVLGGGLVPGSLVLIGGAPGIGKSTITTAALANLSAAGQRVLYVSGEESAAQVRLRAERLGPHALGVPIVADTDL